MRRFSTVLAAAVASAMVVIAVAALDAVGADKPAAASDKPATVGGVPASLLDCLRDHGVSVPALTGTALDQWFRAHVPEATGRTCKELTAPPGEVRAARTADVDKLIGCLRDAGFDPPSDPVALKRWIGEHDSPAVTRALKECGVAPGPPCGAKTEPGGGTPGGSGT
jgi:hypothetical protein